MKLGTAVSASFAALAAGATGLLVTETVLLGTGRHPLTWHTRRAIDRYPRGAFLTAGVIGLTFGALFAHFLWSGRGQGE
jgi:hypothetical protein